VASVQRAVFYSGLLDCSAEILLIQAGWSDCV
jgi:hypothetical protein